MRQTSLLCLVTALLVLVPAVAGAGTISPASFSATIGVGDSVTVTKTVTLDDALSKVDFYFLADNTGSMGGVIGAVTSAATGLTAALSTAYSDAAFGVGRYFGDPSETYGGPLGGGSAPDYNTAYDVLATIGSAGAATTAMGSWTAFDGGDGPEANFYALHQAATDGANVGGPGTGSGESVGWRTGATKVVLWFGDAVSHTVTVSEAAAIAALTANGVIVVGFNSASAGAGIDSGGQASSITSATGGGLENNFAGLSGTDLRDAVVAAVGLATSTFDLKFDDTAPPGVSVSYDLNDPAGYMGVGPGESRYFDVTFTGVTPGTYDFTVYVNPGLIAVEKDRIVVSEIPEPSTLALLGLGVLGLGAVVRRRRKQ